MSVQLSPTPVQKFFDNNGNPLANGSLATYIAGTTTPQATWVDSTQTTQNPNPITLNARGECFLWLDPTLTYKLVLADSFGNLIWTVDQVSTAAGTLGLITATFLGSLLYPVTTAETNAGYTSSSVVLAYPYNDVRRYGINSANTGAVNLAAARMLWNPAITNGPTGTWYFPNVGGTDVYNFSDIIPLRDNCNIDGPGSTLQFTFSTNTTHTNAGCLMAIRNVTIQNISITVNVTYGSGSNIGNAIAFGNRATDCQYFSPLYDSALATPMGNLNVHNVRITSNAGSNAGGGIFLIGGLQGVTIDHVWVNGQTTLSCGIFYEYGWATSATQRYNRQSSHAHNIVIRNVFMNGIATTGFGEGIRLGGVYNALLENIYVNGCLVAVGIDPGEALYYQPWVGVDDVGGKREVILRNINAESATGQVISLSGAAVSYNGYLASANGGPVTPTMYTALTDLMSFDLDGFAVSGTIGNYGVYCSGRYARIANGYVTGCQRGVVFSLECTRFRLEGTDIVGNAGFGVQVGGPGQVWGTARTSVGFIEGNYIAGNNTVGGVNGVGGISTSQTETLLIRGNIIGLGTNHDGTTETFQSYAVTADSTSFGVVCDSNAVGSTASNVAAYQQVGATGSQGCVITNPKGWAVSSGNWDGVLQNATISLSAVNPGTMVFTPGSPVKLDYIVRNGQLTGTFELQGTLTVGTATGNALITGLPVAPNNALTSTLPIGSLQFQGITKAGFTQFVPVGAGGTTTLTIGASESGTTPQTVQITDMSGTIKLFGSISYFI